MTDQVQITKSYRSDHWVVSASLLPSEDSTLPDAVFIYENIGAPYLGPYYGVCSFEEVQRLKVWSGEETPIFGNRFVRHSVAETHLSPGADPDVAVAHILASIKALKRDMDRGSDVSQVYEV